MRKPNHPTRNLFAELLPSVIAVIKIKKPFTLSVFFKKAFFMYVTMMTAYKFGDQNMFFFMLIKSCNCYFGIQ